jgi:magnesium-transporting ATPase (P-type)
MATAQSEPHQTPGTAPVKPLQTDDASARDAADAADALGTDVDRGLSEAEAAARLRQFGPNRLEAAASIPAWRKFLGHFADPLVYLLLAAAAAALVVWILEGREGLPVDAIVIAAIVLANAVLGYVQEARAEQAVAALQRMAAPTAAVLRAGAVERVPAGDVVPGDILVLAEGDKVAADGRLVEAAALTVAEASLTGESEPVLKDVGPLAGPVALGDRVNMVFGATAVTRGSGRAVVTATGMATEMGRVAHLLGRTKEPPTPLRREVQRIGRALSFAVVVIAAVVVTAILLTSDIETSADFVSVLLLGVSLAVAAVPEGLPAVLSVVLALGAQQMAKKKAIVKKLSSVETLGSASAICSDKTGTLTRNEMTIVKVITGSGEVELTGSGYRPEGELRVGGRALNDATVLDEVRAVVLGGSLAGNAALEERDGEWQMRGDPTDASFLVAEAKLPGLREEHEARFKRRGEIPFTYERRLMSTLEEDLAGDLGTAVVTKGAPEVLLARCASERVGGEVRPLSEARREELLAAVVPLADEALRTLAVAYRPLPAGGAAEVDESLERELVFLGLVGIIDPPRPEARAAISECADAGIRVLMITGDHPRTARRIAGDLDIAEPDRRVVTGSELEAAGPEAREKAVVASSVFARVAPEDKLAIVDALQANQQVVAMTGDGVNDAPALKAADIGVAMGVTGTDVAKEAADMILVDDNFATIVAAVRVGRGIFANIEKFLRFLLSSNMGEVLTVFFGVLLATELGLEQAGVTVAAPLLATQILWINLLTDGGPALALGVDPPPDDVMRRPPRRLSDHVIDREMWLTIVITGVVMAAVSLLALDLRLAGGFVGDSGGIDEARTMAFTTLVLAQLFNCFNARSERASAFHGLFTNRWLWAAIALSVVLQIAVVQLELLNDAFGTTPLSLDEWLICTGLASMVLWTSELRKLVARSWGLSGRRAGRTAPRRRAAR